MIFYISILDFGGYFYLNNVFKRVFVYKKWPMMIIWPSTCCNTHNTTTFFVLCKHISYYTSIYERDASIHESTLQFRALCRRIIIANKEKNTSYN